MSASPPKADMLSVEIKPASNGIYGVCRVAEGTLADRRFTLLQGLILVFAPAPPFSSAASRGSIETEFVRSSGELDAFLSARFASVVICFGLSPDTLLW